MSESAVLEAALKVMDTTLEMHSLLAAIDTALAVKAPAGDPDIIAAQADTYGRVAQLCQQVVDDELAVKTKSLPASWRGQAAESATQALGLLTLQAGGAQEAFAAAAKALASWADHLRTAQSQDAQGRAQLVVAGTVLSQLFMQDLVSLHQSVIPAATREAAISGCHDRWEAANLVSSAADAASASLGQWPEQAHAQQIRVPGVDALTAVTLAYYDDGSVLTPTAQMLASIHLDAMSVADRAAFEKLVADASSPTEAEYLFKAASVGSQGKPTYSLGQLESFDAVIHPHGNNPGWLHQHLDPGVITPPKVSNFASKGISISFDNSGMPTFRTNPTTSIGKSPQPLTLKQEAAYLNALAQAMQSGKPPPPPPPGLLPPPSEPERTPVSYGNSAATFSQGQDPDCVAASTAMARLAADPVLMLGVTTGQGPAAAAGAKAGDDSAAAVAARAQTLYNQNYAYGKNVDASNSSTFEGALQTLETPGIQPDKGAIALDDKLLTPVTGSTYQYQPLHNTADRQAALPKIEAAAAAGQPVPIDVEGETSSGKAEHQMIIENYQNGNFEIYNPWGSTQSVTPQQFVDGQLGALTDTDAGGPPGGLPNPFGVALPKQ